MLISTANAILYTDWLAGFWKKLLPVADDKANQAAPVAGTLQNALYQAMLVTTQTLQDYEQEQDLSQLIFTAYQRANATTMSGMLLSVLQSIDGHCNTRGKEVSATIADFSTFLSYYNGGSGGAKFSAMMVPSFAALWLAVTGVNLPAAGVMSPAIQPDYTSGASANGMGSRTYNGSFVAGDSVNTTLYSEVAPLFEVTTDFAGGAAPPQVLVDGTDDGGLTSTTWSVTLDSNNPVSAVSTTITGSVAAQSKGSLIAIGSGSGIVAGSVLTVNSGLPDQEVIVVEAVGTNQITAVFTKAHNAGATLTGKRTYTLTPSVGGKRLRSASNLTYTLSSHSGGAGRIVGRQDRAAR